MLSFACLEDLQVQRYIRLFDNVEFEHICELKTEVNNLKADSKKSVLKFWKDAILLGEKCLQGDNSRTNWQLEMPIRAPTEKDSRKEQGHMVHTHGLCISEGTDRRDHRSRGKYGVLLHMVIEIFPLIHAPHH